MKKYKVKVTMPKQMNMGGYVPENVFAYGGQYGHSLDLGSKRVYDEMGQPDGYAVSNSKLQPIPREMANLEAERGETAYGDLNNDGMMELQEIAGKRHSEKDQYGQGGTPLNLKPGTFIYSDTKSMKLGGAELAQFGKSPNSKKKYTPAELSKQYDVSKYKAIIEDPKADPIAKRTAQYMLNNNMMKLAQLALAQEAKKGFANGIPQVAFPALPPEVREQMQGQQEAESQEMPNEMSEYMKRGGSTYSGNAWYDKGGEANGEMALGQMASVADKMRKLLQFVKPEQNLDPWIASKLAVMDHSADAISDYMMYNPEASETEDELGMEEMRAGGTNNPGFNALPDFVQQKIMDNMAQGGEMIRRADGSYSRRGMWDNIRANRGSGKKPTKEMLKQEKKIRAQEKEYGGDVYAEGGTNNPGFQALPDYVQHQILSNMAYGGIHLDPSKAGTFKAQATRMDMGVQEAAAHIMANKEDYSPEMVKKAVFAHNFAKEYGGELDMYQTKGEVKAKRLKTKAELEKFIKEGYTQIPGTNQYRKETSNTLTQAPTITPGKAAVPGQDAVIQKGTAGKKYVPRENNWWRTRTPKQKAAHNAKIRKMVSTDPVYTGTPDKVIQEAVPAQAATEETKVCPAGYTLNPTTGQCELIQKAEDIVEYDQPEVPGVPSVNPFDPKDGDKFRTMKPDDWAVNQAMMSMAGIPQMNAFMASPRMTQVKGTFMDPTRAYAANEEAAAQQLAGARTFGKPQNYGSIASQIAGKQLEGNANIDSTINAQNVAIANQIEGMNAQYRDKYFGDKMKTDSLYNEQVNAVNKENFRNLDAASKQMLAARQNQFNNAMMMDMVNKNNQYYSVDPRTGQTSLKAGRDPFTDKAGTASGNALELMKKHAADYAAAFPDSTSAERQKYAQEMVIGKQTTRYDSTGAMSGINQILPYLAMMGRGQAAAFQRYGGLVDANSIFPF